jgi:uncharacterized RDD family membrane protein YckC
MKVPAIRLGNRARALPTAAYRRGVERDRTRTVLTPEGIPLRFTLAARSARAGALMIDLILIGVVMIVTTLGLIWIGVGVFKLGPITSQSGALGHALQFLFILWLAAMFLLRNAWFLWFELSPRGATPGKRMSGIRVAARDGGRLTAEMILARNLLRDIELFLPVSFLMAARGGDMGAAGIAGAGWFLIFALFPFFNRDALRAGDLIAGTWVVEAPRRKLQQALSAPSASAPSASAPAGPAAHLGTYRFAEADLAVYGEYELQVLEKVLRENRPEALVAVYARICAKLGWDAGRGDERAFLEAYYTQLRARLESGMRLGKRKADKHAR